MFKKLLLLFSTIFFASQLINSSNATIVLDFKDSENDLIEKHEIYTNNRKFHYDLITKRFQVYKNETKKILTGRLGIKINSNDYSELKTTKLNENDYKIDFIPKNAQKPQIKLQVKNKVNSKLVNDHIVCTTHEWSVANNQIKGQDYFEDCFPIYDEVEGFWYGGSESRYQQYWPINNVSYKSYLPYLTGYSDEWGAVLERYWLSSDGVALIVDRAVPLFVLKNESHLCLQASSKFPYKETISPVMKYDVCSFIESPDKNYLNDLHLYVINNYFAKPTGMPDQLMIKSPIWSSWSIYKTNISTDILTQFAKDILKYNFTHSQIEIDDKWQTFYGDFNFDTKKFSNISAFITNLNNMGFRTTLWVHPFANNDSLNYAYLANKGYAVKGQDGLTALTSWWNSPSAEILDPTNPDASDWFVEQLELLRKKSNINSFKFDAGELSWAPKNFSLFNYSDSPNQYSISYARMAARLGNMIEIRVGSNTQDIPVFVRMIDKDSKWGFDNGLKTLITTALTMSILGYPYILPDEIGGNAYGNTYPDEQLFIRWTQANAFLPAMQFSIVPWGYTEETIAICKKCVDLHENLVYPVLIKEANNAIKYGSPIIRPVWWIDNEDRNLYTINDEFLVGNDILVAPILDENAYSRNIYLPKGTWKAENGTVFSGPLYIENYLAPIDIIPYFISV